MAGKKEKPKGKAVVICTEERAVFFGYADDLDGDKITLKEARMCVYWSSDMHGVMGLASRGPSKSCRVSPKVPELTHDRKFVTCIIACTDEAASKWEGEPWNS